MRNQHKRGTQSNKPAFRKSETANESETISFYFPQSFFFSPAAFPCKLSDKHPFPWQKPSLAPFPYLSYVVSEHQPSFAPPRELQASVTLSYTQCVKNRRQANGHGSVQNQVKCRRLYLTLVVIVTFGEQNLVI